jgi:hypothetical protein
MFLNLSFAFWTEKAKFIHCIQRLKKPSTTFIQLSEYHFGYFFCSNV